MAYTANIIPVMTANDAPSGVASASSELSGTYPAWKAFDHVNAAQTDAWWPTAGTGWVQYQFPAAHTITRYALKSNLGISSYAPKSWTFKGSNDGAAWDTLDTQTNVTVWESPLDCQVFDLANATAYAYYRLDVTEGCNASNLGVGELEMMETALLPVIGGRFPVLSRVFRGV